MPRRMTMVDLFAGCGGMTAGFTATGRIDAIGAVEIDPDAAATYAQNFGEHVYVGDIREWVEGDLGTADVVVGGPPCQGFSQLGLRDPDDPRSRMWDQYVRALVKIRPRYFVMENVPQFLRSSQYAALQDEAEVGGRLSDYRLEPIVLNASDFGTPQNRRRAIVIGSLKSDDTIGLVPAGGMRRTVADAWRGLPAVVREVALPSSTITVNGRIVPGPFKLSDLHITRRPTDLSKRRYAAIPAGGDRRDLPEELKAQCWVKHTSGSSDVMGRLRADRPSVTIRTEFFKPEKGRYLHPSENRPITHAEAALLQGFDEEFLWCGTKVSIARQIGNAVPPPLAQAIAHRLLDHFESVEV